VGGPTDADSVACLYSYFTSISFNQKLLRCNLFYRIFFFLSIKLYMISMIKRAQFCTFYLKDITWSCSVLYNLLTKELGELTFWTLIDIEA